MTRTTLKNILFYSVAILLPIVFLGIIELTFRYLPGYVPDRITIDLQQPDKRIINPEYFSRYFTSFRPSVSISPFEVSKNEGTFRILAVGGSSMAGYPYSHHYSVPSLIELNLKKTFPEVHFEVINVAVTALNSFGVSDIVTKADQLRPDAIIMYTGHNEFYGSLGSASTQSVAESGTSRRLYLNMYSSSIFQLGSKIYRLTTTSEKYDSSRVTTMSRMIGNASIPYQESLFEQTMTDFQYNLDIVYTKASEMSIPVVISTLVSNLKDQPPLGNSQSADEAYQSGLELFKAGIIDSARVWFSKARDLDPIRFRAPTDINQVIHKFAQNDNVHLVDIEASYADTCESGIEDNSCFTDHLHPTYEGYQYIADEILTILKPIISSKKNLDAVEPSGFSYPLLDAIEENLSQINIEILSSAPPFDRRYESAGRSFQEIITFLKNTNEPISSSVFSILSSQKHPSNVYEDLASDSTFKQFGNGSFYYSWSEWNPLNESIIRTGLSGLVTDQNFDISAEALLLKASNDFDTTIYYNLLGAFYLQRKEYESAKAFLQIVEKRDPEEPSMLYNLAVLHYETGDIDNALKYQSRYQSIVGQ